MIFSRRWIYKMTFVCFFILCFINPTFTHASEINKTVKKVVVIVTMPIEACEAHLRYFKSQLIRDGYKDGENLELVVIRANGDRQVAEAELRKTVNESRPDAVATIATLASQAAKNVLHDTDIPIFFFQVSDPVGAGLIHKIGEPTGTNITGRVFTVPNKVRVSMVMRLVGQTSNKRPVRFGYIHSSYPSAVGDKRSLKLIDEQRKDITFHNYLLEYQPVPDGIPEMLTAVEKHIHTASAEVDFWWQPQGPLAELKEYVSIFNTSTEIPTAIGGNLYSVKRGALIHITPNIEASGREAAEIVGEFLKGSDPGKIPVTLPTLFDIGINMSTALRLGILVPPDMLKLAGNNIYH